MFKGQFRTANFLLAEVNMLPELGYGIQRSVVLKAQSADLKRKWEGDIRIAVQQILVRRLMTQINKHFL